MRLPAPAISSFEVDEVKLGEEMHGCQGHLAPCRIQSVENTAQVAHGLLLRRQGIYQGLPRNEILGPQLGEVTTRVGQPDRDGSDGPKDVGPVNGRCSNEYLK